MKLRGRLAMLALPYVRRELPGWGTVLRTVGAIGRTDVWRNAPTVTIRGKYHGYLMKLDLSDAWDRRTFFVARFVELETELFFREVVRLGDTVIDVGANRGMFTLLASYLVGSAGRVHAVEPNPQEAGRIAELIRINDLENVQLHRVAFGDSVSTRTLQVLDGLTALATLARLDEDVRQHLTASMEVSVVRGDELLGDELPGNTFLKVDVEGFECRVLAGFGGLLERVRPIVYAEVEPEWLERAGASATELFAMLAGLGYRGYHPWTRRIGLRHQLVLTPVSGAHELAALRSGHVGVCRNFAWIHPDSVFVARLSNWIASCAS